MKPVFKCDYCTFMGTEEEVREHEPQCRNNYDMRSCHSCEHRGKFQSVEGGFKYECNNGKDIPINSIYQYCEKYERRKESKHPLMDIFGKSIFGGFGI